MHEHDHHKHADACCGGDDATRLVKDPVCGMNVDPATAKHSAELGDHIYYFCYQGCKNKFLADPERFLAAKREAPSSLIDGEASRSPITPPHEHDQDADTNSGGEATRLVKDPVVYNRLFLPNV